MSLYFFDILRDSLLLISPVHNEEIGGQGVITLLPFEKVLKKVVVGLASFKLLIVVVFATVLVETWNILHVRIVCFIHMHAY